MSIDTEYNCGGPEVPPPEGVKVESFKISDAMGPLAATLEEVSETTAAREGESGYQGWPGTTTVQEPRSVGCVLKERP